MWRKKIAMALGFMMGILATGCSMNAEEVSNSSEEEVSITFSWWGNDERHEATIEAIEVFEEKYPYINVNVEFSEWTGFQKKMNIYVAGHTEPDLMQLNYDWLEKYSADGLGFYDLSTLGDQITLDAFSEEILSYGYKNGKLNAIPISMNGKLLMYNQNLYDSFGVNIPTTWDELFAAGEAFDKEGYYPLSLDRNMFWNLACTYIEQKTGHTFVDEKGNLGFTKEDLMQIAKFYEMMRSKGVIPPVTKSSDKHIEDGFYGGSYRWITNIKKVANSISEHNKDKMVLGQPLIMEGAKSSGWVVKPSTMLGISAESEHPQEAALLLNFLLNDPAAISLLGTERGVPVSKIAYKQLEFQIPTQEKEALTLINQNNPVLISPYVEHHLVTECYEEAVRKLEDSNADLTTWVDETYNALVKQLVLAQK